MLGRGGLNSHPPTVERGGAQKSLLDGGNLLLRRGGSNSRPSGYEPDELPLLYFAMWGAKVRVDAILSKLK